MRKHPAADTHSGNLLTRNQTAEYLSVSVRTLERWEDREIGPTPVRIGATGRSVRYRAEEVEEWVRSVCDQPR